MSKVNTFWWRIINTFAVDHKTRNIGPPSQDILTLSPCTVLDPHPPYEEHASVVINVEEGDLVVLLTQCEHCRLQQLAVL